ncbi:solute carrier organic anion transporter family member 74D [Condylostylus longicornis]|uniref:solute carrier organic anion transporter family member 74D n=1 Tax=Condylostylus longicornis TaxID=2530218 RepID=UPI00244DB59E|nr:solute carrier organic anion transporter family member 74D [Condylostylus longicornis]
MEPNTPLIQANSHNIQEESLDCGLKSIGWCGGSKCQNLATSRNFIIAFAVVTALQGAVMTYFRLSAQQAGMDLGFDPYIIDWLLVSVGLTQGVIAFGLVFYSQRFHPMSWISGFILLEAAFAIITIIPALHFLPNQGEQSRPVYAPPLCIRDSYKSEIEKPHGVVTLILLFVLHSVISITNAIIYCIGYSYIDDNSKPKNAAILLGIGLAAHFWGAQLGAAVSLQVDALPLGWWLGWVIIVPLLIISAIIIGLFPRKLVRTIVRQAADLIIQRMSQPNLIESVEYVKEFTFFPTLKRLITNRTLMFNLLAFTFLETVLINFSLQEEEYMQSRFFIATSEANGLLDEWMSRFLLIILKPPILGFTILFAAFIVAKLQPSAKSLAAWNAIVEILVCLFFVSYIFLHCSSETLTQSYKNNKVMQPDCSTDCYCGDDVLFMPVCTEREKKTYFSPCHAGCNASYTINNVVMYKNCLCGSNHESPFPNGVVTSGACNFQDCRNIWLIYQALALVAAILLASCEVNRMLITFRSVLPQDKALALSMEITIAGLFVNIPGKLAYDYIASSTCEYYSQSLRKCALQQSPLHGNILNIVSAILFAISAVFDILNAIFIKDIDCFTKTKINKSDGIIPVPLQPMNSRVDQTDVNENSNTGNENEINPGQRQPQTQYNSYLRNYQDSSPDSSLFQNSPRRIGGRRSRSPVSSQSSIVNPNIQYEEVANENASSPKRLSPQNQNVNYAQVMFEFKKKSKSKEIDPVSEEQEVVPKSLSPVSEQTTSNIGSDLDENLDFRLQRDQPITRQDMDADDELSELDTKQKNGKVKAKETSF